MKTRVQVLVTEHAEIRRRMAELERLLGERRGVGWDDRADCDLAALSSSWSGFREFLTAHEAGEEAALRSLRDGVPEIEEWIEKNHRGHDEFVRLLGSVAATCDGRHVHSLRFALEELRHELDAHMEYEEKVVFPLLADSLPRS